MIEFYPEVRLVHITAVLTSGGLFLIRGLALFASAGWAMSAPLRYLGYAIDTVLLTAALMLTTMVQQYPFVHAWLTVKILLLIVYIVLGVIAFRLGRSRSVRIGSWIAAVAVYSFIVSVALAHDPLGFLASFSGS